MGARSAGMRAGRGAAAMVLALACVGVAACESESVASPHERAATALQAELAQFSPQVAQHQPISDTALKETRKTLAVLGAVEGLTESQEALVKRADKQVTYLRRLGAAQARARAARSNIDVGAATIANDAITVPAPDYAFLQAANDVAQLAAQSSACTSVREQLGAAERKQTTRVATLPTSRVVGAIVDELDNSISPKTARAVLALDRWQRTLRAIVRDVVETVPSTRRVHGVGLEGLRVAPSPGFYFYLRLCQPTPVA